ncbi:hypothetical protein Bbelb_251560 [Branchiostoma belcheri]|nr:hypothetical protein Bbelb_251560 [Branchiostoma belcheri]
MKHGSEYSTVLDTAGFWIQQGSGYSTVLDTAGFWIQHGSGYSTVLDTARFWIQHGSGYSTVLDKAHSPRQRLPRQQVVPRGGILLASFTEKNKADAQQDWKEANSVPGTVLGVRGLFRTVHEHRLIKPSSGVLVLWHNRLSLINHSQMLRPLMVDRS